MTAATCPETDTRGVEGFTSYRGRTLAGVHRVDVYRNLNEQKRSGRVRWSIRDADTGLVLGHADKLALSGGWVHVNVTAQRRIAAGGARQVHAWVTGSLTFCPTDSSPWYAHAQRVLYRPHEGPRFRFEQSDEVCQFIPVARFDQAGMWAGLPVCE